VLGITVVTDKCLPDALEPADVATIIATAESAEPHLAALLTRIMEKLA
jgi:purine-nucleoside phosphorylase